MFRHFFGRFFTNATIRSSPAVRRFAGGTLAFVAGYTGYKFYHDRKYRNQQASFEKLPVAMYNEELSIQRARAKLKETFRHLAVGLGITGAATCVGYALAGGVATTAFAGIGMLGSLGCMGGMFYSRYKQKPDLAKYFYYGFAAVTGLSFCIFNPHIALRASVYTGALSAGIGTTAYYWRGSDKIELLAAPLFIGLNIIFVSSILGLFPGFWRRYPELAMKNFNLYLYGGLGLFGAYLLYDMKFDNLFLFTLFFSVLFRKYLNVEKELIASNSYRGGMSEQRMRDLRLVQDPLWDCFDIYLDVINIMWRIAIILSNNDNK